jgi:hypothetical protein
MKHRYSLTRWKTIVSMMIYKEPGNVKIHRLRVIHLYEADLSLLLGIKWRLGMHNTIFVHATTLEEAEFKLKISTKVSNTSYKHCIKFLIHGTGQGSSNSPMIWCFISCILFGSHEEQANGILFESPNTELLIKITLAGFVDDSTSCNEMTGKETLQDLIRKI